MNIALQCSVGDGLFAYGQTCHLMLLSSDERLCEPALQCGESYCIKYDLYIKSVKDCSSKFAVMSDSKTDLSNSKFVCFRLLDKSMTGSFLIHY